MNFCAVLLFVLFFHKVHKGTLCISCIQSVISRANEGFQQILALAKTTKSFQGNLILASIGSIKPLFYMS
jgi:hypothetical protein